MRAPLYFAYGSNLHPERLAKRAPSAVTAGVGVAPGFVLRFHKRGRDGSGKCDMVPTSRATDVVHGALYRLEAGDVAALHACEGVGRGYAVHPLRVHGADGVVDAFTYRAAPGWIDPALAPWDWYKALVLAGARYHGFAHDYVCAIEAVPSRPDPDGERAARHAALLARIGRGMLTDATMACQSREKGRRCP